jgi:hypothetical protein
VHLFQVLDGFDNLRLRRLFRIYNLVGIGPFRSEQMLRYLTCLSPDCGVVVHDVGERVLGNLEYTPDRMVAVIVGSFWKSLVYAFDNDGAEGPV